MSQYEKDYCALVRTIMAEGKERQTRNAVTKSIFGVMLKVNTGDGEFPVLSGRRMFPRGVVGELAAMLKGPKTVADFEAEGCNYWKKWGKPDGSIEVDYGNAWLDFNGVNQLKELVDGIRRDPHGRRHIVTGWRPDTVKTSSLPCCHLLYQWYVDGDRLNMVWYQRSVDTMVGLPSDVILAYVWNHLVANEVRLKPGELTLMLGDTHIYQPHYENVRAYLLQANDHVYSGIGGLLPQATGLVGRTMSDFDPKAFTLLGYNPEPKIDFELIA